MKKLIAKVPEALIPLSLLFSLYLYFSPSIVLLDWSVSYVTNPIYLTESYVYRATVLLSMIHDQQ